MPEMILQNELEKLQQFEKNSEWFQNHYEELRDKYKDQYVAINLGIKNVNPLDHDRDYERLINRLRENYGDLGAFVIELVYEQRPIDVLS
ncbi:MAG: DUF5678 domain-containing protein [Candidatus Nitrosopolaris sp.]